MPSLAKAYIATIATLATVVLAIAASRWNPQSLAQFAGLFALALLASAMKIHLPGFKTTISTHFVFILTGIAVLSFSETVLLGLGGALVQSLWKTRQRPKPVQVLFNGACLTVCAAAAYWVSHNLPAMLGVSSIAALMVVGAVVYVVLNTGLVSLVVSLAERSPLKKTWPSCYESTFPYFLVGSAVAGLASAASQGGTTWGVTLIVVPVMYCVYVYYRMHMIRVVLESISHVSRENETALAGVSQGR
jgi:hypothetical protein